MAKRAPELTAAAAHRLAPRTKQYEVRDGGHPGLMLRVYPLGSKHWGFRARQDGRLRYIAIGGFPGLSLAAARKRAVELRRQLDLGGRPADERALRRSEPTLGEIWDDYRARHDKAPRSRAEDLRRWRQHIAPWRGRPARSVPRKDVARLQHRIAVDHGPVESNRTMALLRHIYSWSLRNELIECANPASGIQREPESPRERVVSSDELRRLQGSIAAEPDPTWRAFFRLLLLTGCRRGELLAARWEWLRDDVLLLPRELTKQRKPHMVPLSSQAVAILDELPSRGVSPYLFAGENGGPLAEPKHAWRRIRERAGIEDVTIHDLRHLVGSSLGSAGENAFLIRDALGHSQISTTQRYVELEIAATRRALEAHAERLAHNAADEPDAK